jgi:autotransporter adhesin
VGPAGPQGPVGATGAQGVAGATGATGATGAQGPAGASAYEDAVANGYSGTEQQWLASLVGNGTGGCGAEAIACGDGATAAVEGAVAVGRDAQAQSAGSVAIGDGAVAASSVAVGAGSGALGTNTTAVGDAALASGDYSAAYGNQAQATADNSVAIGNGSVANAADTVSVGAAGGERRVTNVAAGTGATDAANVGQVQAGDAAAVTASKTYTDARFAAWTDGFAQFEQQLEVRFAQTDARIDRLGAMNGAMSAAAMNTAGLPGRNRVGVGVGSQGGKSALAVSYQRLVAPNASVSLGGAFSGSERSVSAGAGFSW